MATEEKIPPYFIRVKDEKMIPSALKYLKETNNTGYAGSHSGGGMTMGGRIPRDHDSDDEEDDILVRVRLIIGEINAGNDSPVLTRELDKKLKILLQKKIINLYKYTEIKKKYLS